MNPPPLKHKRRITPSKPINPVAAYDYYTLRKINKMARMYSRGGAQSDDGDSTVNDESFSTAYTDYNTLQNALPMEGIGELKRRDDNWMTRRRKKQPQM